MPVTKQTFSISAPWTAAQFADMLGSAFAAAGLMTDWYDSYTKDAANIVRVLEVQHNNTKTYGKCFYPFVFSIFASQVGLRINITSGWDTGVYAPPDPPKKPVGTQFLDYFTAPNSYDDNDARTTPVFTGSTTSNLFLDRYTSGDDAKQTWFILRQGVNVGVPFTILHKDTLLHPWLDLDKGMISGHLRQKCFTWNRVGGAIFEVSMALRRTLLLGTALRGADTGSWQGYTRTGYRAYSYVGCGSQSNNPGVNLPSIGAGSLSAGELGGGLSSQGLTLPVGKNSANPAFLQDYVPVCTDLPWSPWTPTRLADDFGIYMHYADNTIGYGNKFIVQAGLNEWEVISFANNTVINDGASATFLARVV
jgi:hypothetical protein